MTHGVRAESGLYAVSHRACSLAMQSVTETKDTLLLVCIGLLEALDRLQERLHLPLSIVKDIKRKLTKMVDRSYGHGSNNTSPMKFKQYETLGDAIAESDMWDVAKPEEVHGMVHWIVAVTKSLNQLVLAGSYRVCRGIFILIMNLPGVSLACALFYRIFQLVEDTLSLSSDEVMEATSGGKASGHRPATSYIADPSLTAVVLEYREKECMVPMNINRRIQRVMHFQIPLRSFEATVRLPPDHGSNHPSLGSENTVAGQTASSTSSHLSSTSPRSIPVSPLARKRVQLAFSNFSDDVLYQARDRLRQERAATLAGEREHRIPRFSTQDSHEEIYLSCGRHCASKVGTGMYRSARGTVPLPKNRYVYFEMTLQQERSQSRPGNLPNNLLETAQMNTGASRNSLKTGAETSVCIGLSTRGMPLNTLVGASKYTIGFYSAGHVLIGSDRRSFVSVNRGYGYEATVGVLVRIVEQIEGELTTTDSSFTDESQMTASIAHAVVRFSVNGEALRDDEQRVLEFTLPFPSKSDVYPTLTLHSQDIQVYSRFSSPDIIAQDLKTFDLPAKHHDNIWCLDGLKFGISA